ncbi:MAG: hypothetical protein IJ091_02490 [Oscillospiraceae bacterium]|nr:hypothetical protein [Oscillospiraceae bacterium]
MDFYTERLEPMLRKTAKMIEETPAMQSILHGTMTPEQYKYYYLQDYQYLLDYTRVWSTALGKCDDFQDMKLMLTIINDVVEAIDYYRDHWAKTVGVTPEDMDNVIMGEGKRSYTAYLSHIAHTCDAAGMACAVFPCGIMYTFFAEDLLSQCTLEKDNTYREWLEYFATDHYKQEAANKKEVIRRLCNDLPENQLRKLELIVATSCNYEIWQWTDAYWNNTTWPLDEIFPAK